MPTMVGRNRLHSLSLVDSSNILRARTAFREPPKNMHTAEPRENLTIVMILHIIRT